MEFSTRDLLLTEDLSLINRGKQLVGGLEDPFYQFFMPIPLDVTLLLSFYPSDNFTQENMQTL